jgi:hypothetical protein
MLHIRKISVLLTIVAIALTWLSLAGVRTAALIVRVLGAELGAELFLPARMLRPAATVVMVVLASAGSLLLILIQIWRVRQEMRLLILSAYVSLLAMCLLAVFVVSMLQVHTLLFPAPVPGTNF